MDTSKDRNDSADEDPKEETTEFTKSRKRKSVVMNVVDISHSSKTDEAVILSTENLTLEVQPSVNSVQHLHRLGSVRSYHHYDARPKGSLFTRNPKQTESDQGIRPNDDARKSLPHKVRSSYSTTTAGGQEKWNKQSISTYYSPDDLQQEFSGSEMSSEESIDISDYDNSDLTDTEYNEDEDCNKKSYTRNMYAFWLLGLCHKMTYNMTVAASRDILYYYVSAIFKIE